jgi:hypothetical protein
MEHFNKEGLLCFNGIQSGIFSSVTLTIYF